MQMGAFLGYLDKDMQLRTIDLYLQELGQEIKATGESIPGKQKLSRSLGIMGGLFLVYRKMEGSVEVSIIFKIAAVGILVSMLSQVLKHSGRDEQAFLISLAGLLIVLFWLLPYIYELFETIKNLFLL